MSNQPTTGAGSSPAESPSIPTELSPAPAAFASVLEGLRLLAADYIRNPREFAAVLREELSTAVAALPQAPAHNPAHDGMIRGFYHLSEAWYANANLVNRHDGLVDEVMLGFYGPNGDQGTTGEFAVAWKQVGGRLTPQLRVFDDAWEVLTHFSDVLAEMAKLNNTNTSPSEFCELLKRLGLKDLTPRESRWK